MIHRYPYSIHLLKISFLTALSLIVVLPVMAQMDKLDGAWHLENYSFEGEQMQGVIDPAQAGVFLFVDSHYSISYVLGDKPRAFLSAEPTPAEIVVAYRSFIANTGTYEASDSTILTFPLVTRNPNVQAGDSKLFYITTRYKEIRWNLCCPKHQEM